MNRRHYFGLLAGSIASVAVAAPAFAQEGKANRPATAGPKANRAAAAKRAKRRAVQGVLAKVEGTAPLLTLSLETKHNGLIVVTTSEDTEFRGKGHDDLTLAGLKDSALIGARLIVVGTRDGDKLVARHLVVRPAKNDQDDDDGDDGKDKGANRTTATGIIGGLPASGAITSFTVTPAGGTAVTYVANADTEYSIKGAVLANGLTVRVTSKQDGSNNVALKVRYPA